MKGAYRLDDRELQLRGTVAELLTHGWTIETLAAQLRKPIETIQAWLQGEGLPTKSEKAALTDLAKKS